MSARESSASDLRAQEDWKHLLPGGMVVAAGNSSSVDTGAWRITTPVLDLAKCTHCMICWIFCPDDSILTEHQRVTGIDLFHCKGCGICALVCPAKALAMEGPGAAANSIERGGERESEDGRHPSDLVEEL